MVLGFSALNSSVAGPNPVSPEVPGQAEECTSSWGTHMLTCVLMGQPEIVVLGEASAKMLLIVGSFWDPPVLRSLADFGVRVVGP